MSGLLHDPILRLLLWIWAVLCLTYVAAMAFLASSYKLSEGGMPFLAFAFVLPLTIVLWVIRRG